MKIDKRFSQLEIARILGEPKDPRKPYPHLIDQVCETDTADPDEYMYYFDVLLETDKIYVITANGAVTTENVAPDTPAALTFADLASPEYYIKITDLAKAKEKTLARKVRTINRALNAYENYKVIDLINTAVVGQGNLNDLRSGETSFNYQHLIDMIDQVIDYGDNFTLIAGTAIDKDIKLWNWKDNKYHNLLEAFSALGINVVRINQTVTIDGSATAALDSNVAYLVAKSTEMGKPVLFVRKKLDDIEMLGGVLYENGDKPERLVFVSPNPVQVSTTRYLAVGITGYEEYAAAVTNPYALSKFTRTV